MKKNYQAPLMRVVKIQAQKMLAGSLTESTSGAQSVGNGMAGARGGRGDWGDED